MHVYKSNVRATKDAVSTGKRVSGKKTCPLSRNNADGYEQSARPLGLHNVACFELALHFIEHFQPNELHEKGKISVVDAIQAKQNSN